MVLPGNQPCKKCLGEGAKVMRMEKTISGHLGTPCGEWGARQREEIIAGRGEISVPYDRECDDGRQRRDASHGGAASRPEHAALRCGGPMPS